MSFYWSYCPVKLQKFSRCLNATSNFDNCHDILCLSAEFAAKHTKAQSPLTTHWKTWPVQEDFGSWQSPDISRSHLYRGTFPWTPPTAIYRAYTVSILGMEAKNYKFGMSCQQCQPSVAPGDADIWPVPPGFTPAICLRRNFVYIPNLENRGDKSVYQNF